jgi:protein LTV1
MKACTIRPKNETSEERHIRKSAIKDERRMRRSNKKSTQEMFKKEKLKMEKLLITNPRTKPVL